MKTGLVLGGGGSRGAYQVGALKAFNELGIKFDVGTGTSVGSINIMTFAENKCDMLEEIWKNLTFETVCNHQFKWKNKANEILLKAPFRAGFSIEPLKDIIRKYIKKEYMENSTMKVGVVRSTGLFKYSPVVIDPSLPHEYCEYVIASCSASPFLKKHIIDGKKYCDGWYTDNLPIKLAGELGAEKIVAIDVMKGFSQGYDKTKLKVFTIKPSQHLRFFLDFDNEYINSLIELGYEDVMAQKEEIQKFLAE